MRIAIRNLSFGQQKHFGGVARSPALSLHGAGKGPGTHIATENLLFLPRPPDPLRQSVAATCETLLTTPLETAARQPAAMAAAAAPCSHRGPRHCLPQRPAAATTAATTTAAAPARQPPHSRQRALGRRAGTRLAAAYTTTSSRASSSGSGDSFADPAAVDIAIEPGPSNSRCIWAGVDIAAPAAGVYGALTAYEALGTFIPGEQDAAQSDV